ncbi:MAG: GcrA cell cycle regulator [Rhodobacteraceae bacterium]|nr:GcrA cell cycle regulator [Paracoccaceae bacterium]
MSWTDERVETLKTMWGDGKSASQIAKELGGVTRNAVIGKVHRLGLSNRAGPAAKPPAREKPAPKVEAAPEPEAPPKEEPVEAAPVRVAPIPPRRPIIKAGQPLPPQPSANEVSAEALANVRAVEKTARRLRLMELTERTCKWPIGDPATDDFWFCGHAVQPGKPYCDAHVAVAFQPMSSRRDRRASR